MVSVSRLLHRLRVPRGPARTYGLQFVRSLRFRLFVALFASVVLVNGLAAWSILTRIEQSFDAQMREQALTMGKLTQALYDQRGGALLDMANLIARRPDVQQAIAKDDQAQLAEISRPLDSAMPGATVAFFDPSGNALYRDWAPDVFGGYDGTMIGLRRALQGQPNNSIENAGTLGLALHGFAPVIVDGRVIGAVGVNERFDQELIDRTKEATGYAATILAPDGTPLYWTPDPVHAVSVLRPGVPQQALATIQSGHEFTVLTYMRGMPFGSYALPLRDPEGKLVGIVTVTTSLSELGAAQTAVRRAFLAIGALAFAVALGVAWLLSRSFIRPLQQLTAAATRMASGSYDDPAGVRIDNEIGVLARAFDHMRERVGVASRALREAKANAENERNLMNAILNSTRDGIIMFDAERRFKVANRRWEALFGLRADELEGLTQDGVLELLRPLFSPSLGQGQQARDAQYADDVERTLELAQLKPARRVLRRYSAPVHDAAGQTIGRIYVYQDVTRERQSDQMKSALISTVSHELRLPLTSIKGYARTLMLDDPPWDVKERREFLQYIDEESDKLSEMVDNLLDVSKIEAGVLQVQRLEMLLPVLVRKVVERQERLLSRVTVSVQFPEHFPVVEADSRRIEQVLYNLLENAVKYGRPDGHIAITGAVRDDEVSVSVIDDGQGIPPEDAERVFERFYQVDQSLTRQAGGFGLGLSICRGIVEAHGGRIWVEPREPGSGFAVTFTLPRRAGPAAAGEAAGAGGGARSVA